MKKALLPATAVALAFFAGSALAADLPSQKGPPPAYLPPPPLLTWTGFYVGVNAGYTWNDSNVVSLPSFDTGAGGFTSGQLVAAIPTAFSLTSDGFIGGGQVGYNWQFGNSFVAGVEADIQGIASGSRSAAFATPVGILWQPTVTQVSRSQDYLGTVRGRLGYLFTPTLLVYGTGGLAYGQTSLSASTFGPTWNPPLAGATTYSETRVGWTAGGGVEWMFAPNWSAKAEYLYYDLGTVTAPTIYYAYGAALTGIAPSARFNGHIVRAGLNYHFNWGSAPVVAKY
jgi:outer membrane immunogenic protein